MQPSINRHLDIPHYLLVCIHARHRHIRLAVAAIEGDKYLERSVRLEPFDGLLVQQKPVGINKGSNTVVEQVHIDVPEGGVRHGLAARERCIHHACVDGLLNQRNPLFPREHPLLHRRILQMHIAHLAVEVAQRCQLETATVGDIRLAGPFLHHGDEFSIG